VHGRGWPGHGVGLARHETRSSSVVGRMYGWREPTSSRRRRSLHAHGQREEPAPCFGSCLVGGFGWNSLLGDRAPVEESSAASKTIRSTATRPKIMIDAYIYLSLFALFVSKCNMLTSLFTIHVAAQLENLQKLTVQDNTGLTEIISTEGPKAALSVQAFSRVTHLSLQGLPKLKHFNSGDINIDWPALIKLKLGACPALTELPIGLRMNTIDLDSSDDWTWYNQLINQGRPKCFEIWVNGEKHGS